MLREAALPIDEHGRKVARVFEIWAIVIVALWVLGGPGHKHDEHILMFAVSILIGIPAVIASLAHPSVTRNVLFYPGVFLAGYVLNWARIAALYDYDFWTLRPWSFGCGWAGLGAAGLFVLNLITVAIATHGEKPR